MAARRILLLYNRSLLAQGLLSLLKEQSGVEVRASRLSDAGVTEFVQWFAPDIVVIDRDDFARQAAITIDQLLRDQPQMRVIDVSTRNDVARVYEGHQVEMAKLDDLLAAFAGSVDDP